MSKRGVIAAVLLGVSGMVVACSVAPSGTPAPEQPFESRVEPPRPFGFALTSSAFASGSPIPAEHAMAAAGGRNVSIPLRWANAPAATESFAIEVVDVHPLANNWVHWLVTDIPASTKGLSAGASRGAMPSGASELLNGFGERGWGGPQPPPGSGTHEYLVTVYALDTPTLRLSERSSLQQFRDAVGAHTLDSASISGTFER